MHLKLFPIYRALLSSVYIDKCLACFSRNMFIREKNVRFYTGHMGIWLYLNFPFQGLLLWWKSGWWWFYEHFDFVSTLIWDMSKVVVATPHFPSSPFLICAHSACLILALITAISEPTVVVTLVSIILAISSFKASFCLVLLSTVRRSRVLKVSPGRE